MKRKKRKTLIPRAGFSLSPKKVGSTAQETYDNSQKADNETRIDKKLQENSLFNSDVSKLNTSSLRKKKSKTKSFDISDSR